MTIEEIKQACIEIDIANVQAGDESIGQYIDGKFFQFKNLRDVELYYHHISLKELLSCFSSYYGLECYRADEPKDYAESYNVDILSILEYMTK
tara:strand:- start:190 stop:468 length:279 start_codon:yes stop_codon:yes gene_type:complete